MSTKTDFLFKRKSGPQWREIEKRAKPWQQEQCEHTYNPETASGPPPWTGPTTSECAGPASPPISRPSDEEYARRAAAIRASKRGTRFYDGFIP